MKMKWKVLSIIVCFALILGVVSGAVIANAEGEFAIVGDSAQAQPGEQVAVQIMLENNPGISALNLYYIYNKDVLSLTKVENNISHFTMTNDVTTVWDAASNYEGNGVLATLTFMVAEDAPAGEYNIELKFLSASNDTFEEVTASSGVATIEVSCSHKDTTKVDQVDATCAQSGFTAGVYCNDCQTYISGHEEIPATGEHSDADEKWNYDADGHYCECSCGLVYAAGAHKGGSATCTTKAVCDTCHVEYGSVDTSSHGQTEVRNASEASCNQEGYTGDTYCVDCGEMISTGSVIPATGKHIGGEATCMEQAVCEICGAAYGELNADNHGKIEIKGAVEATCGNAGFSGDVYCVDCDELIEAGSMIAATGAHTDADEDAICDDCGAELPKTEEPNEDKPNEENPKTGDFSMVWITMLMICSVLAVVCVGKKNSMA